MRIENSFLLAPGVGEKTEKKLWKQGITHWDDVTESSISDNKKQKISNFLSKARKNLEVGNSVFFGSQLPSKSVWRMYRNFEESATFFDIETTGLSPEKNKVTTVSLYRGGESKTFVQGQDLTRENLQKEIHKSKVLVSFNGKMFDQPFLEKNYNLDIELPHIDLMHSCRRIGLTGGLKKIEKDLGVERELEDIDGREAVRLWKKYENKGNENALEDLIRYNRYDTENLEQVLELVHSRLEHRFFLRHVENRNI